MKQSGYIQIRWICEKWNIKIFILIISFAWIRLKQASNLKHLIWIIIIKIRRKFQNTSIHSKYPLKSIWFWNVSHEIKIGGDRLWIWNRSIEETSRRSWWRRNNGKISSRNESRNRNFRERIAINYWRYAFTSWYLRRKKRRWSTENKQSRAENRRRGWCKFKRWGF